MPWLNESYDVWLKKLDYIRNDGRHLLLDVPFKLTGFLVSLVDFLFDDHVLAEVDLTFVEIEGLVNTKYMFCKLD